MLPTINDGLTADFTVPDRQPSNTFKLHIDKNRCYGFTDEVDALVQAIFLMLSIDRYEYPIYSWNTGFESKDLIGKPMQYVISEIKRRIPDCLLVDDRINAVENFEFNVVRKGILHVKCTVISIYGDIEIEREVIY